MKKKIIIGLGISLIATIAIGMNPPAQLKANEVDKTATSSSTDSTEESQSVAESDVESTDSSEASESLTTPNLRAAPFDNLVLFNQKDRANKAANWEIIDVIEDETIPVKGVDDEFIKYHFGGRMQVTEKLSDLKASAINGEPSGELILNVMRIPNVSYVYKGSTNDGKPIDKNMGTLWGGTWGPSTSPGVVLAQGKTVDATGADIDTNVPLVDINGPFQLYKRKMANGLMEFKFMYSSTYTATYPNDFAPKVIVEITMGGQTDGLVNHNVKVTNVDNKAYNNFVLGKSVDIRMLVLNESVGTPADSATTRSLARAGAGVESDRTPFYFSEDGNGLFMDLKDVQTGTINNNPDNKAFKMYYYFEGLNQDMTGPDNWAGAVHTREFRPLSDEPYATTNSEFFGYAVDPMPLPGQVIKSYTDFYHLNEPGQETRILPGKQASVYYGADSEIAMKNQPTSFGVGESLTFDYQVGLKAQSSIPAINWDEKTKTVEPNPSGRLNLPGKWSENTKDQVDLFYSLDGTEIDNEMNINNPDKGFDVKFAYDLDASKLKFGPNLLKAEISNRVTGGAKGSDVMTLNVQGRVNVVYQDDSGAILPAAIAPPISLPGLKDQAVKVTALDLTAAHYAFEKFITPDNASHTTPTVDVPVANAEQTVKVVYKAIPQTVTQTIEYRTVEGQKVYDTADKTGNTFVADKPSTVTIGDVIQPVTSSVAGYHDKGFKDDNGAGFYVPGTTVPDKNFVIRVVCDPIFSFTAPTSLNFGTHELLVSGKKDITPENDYDITVTDTRDKNIDKNWQISLKVKTPMHLEGSPTKLFNGAMKFNRKDGNQDVVQLNDQGKVIHERSVKAVGEQAVTWSKASGEGLVLEQRGGNSKGTYTTVLEWDILVAGP